MKVIVVAIQATDIPKMGFLSKADPYLVMKISSDPAEYRTKFCDDTLAPVWNQRFDFNIINQNADYLIIQLKDWNTVDQHKIISRIEIPLRTIPVGKTNDMWFDMIPCIDKPKGGKIRLLIEITDGQNHRPPVQRPPPPQMQQPQPHFAPPQFRPPPMQFGPPPQQPPMQFYGYQPQWQGYEQRPPMNPHGFAMQHPPMGPMQPMYPPMMPPSPQPGVPMGAPFIRPAPNPYAAPPSPQPEIPQKNQAWFGYQSPYN